MRLGFRINGGGGAGVLAGSRGDLKRQALLGSLVERARGARFYPRPAHRSTPLTNDLLLNEISTDPFWADHAGTVEALRHLAAVTPDSDLMLGALRDQPIRLVGFGDFFSGRRPSAAGSIAKYGHRLPGASSADGTVSEIVYHSPSWRLPAPYYSFMAGPVQFFALDTTEVSAAQVAWLTQAVATSRARWKVVYGHHPIFSPDSNPKSREHMRYLQERIWPIIRGKADAYLCGHQHAMAHMDTRDGVHFFMSGGGGAPLSAIDPKVAHTRFVAAAFGFLTLEADADRMRIAIYDATGRAYDGDSIARPPATK